MPPNQNPYDFINDSSSSPKKSLLSGGDTKTRVIQVAIFASIILVLLIIFYSLVFGNKTSAGELLLKPAAQQTDLIAITEIGSEKVRDGNKNQLMNTANIILQSQNAQTLAIIKKSGVKAGQKELAIYKDPKFKDVLDEAEASGKFEETFLGIYQNRLDQYAIALKAAYASSSGSAKDQLGKMYKELEELSLTKEEVKPATVQPAPQSNN